MENFLKTLENYKKICYKIGMKDFTKINICNYIPISEYNDFQTINYVYETKESVYSMRRYQTHYRLCFVTDGEGKLNFSDKEFPLKEGDIFVEFPSYFYSLINVKDFAFCYIDFIGLEASEILKKLSITPSNFLFHEYGHLKEIWQKYINVPKEINDLASKSVVMLTLTEIGNNGITEQNESTADKGFYEIKKFVDENFNDADLKLSTLSEKFFYSPKYISTLFIKNLKTGFSEYLNLLRLQNAKSLIERRFLSVSNIANLCGFKDALYFSKLYKKRYGISPSEDIRRVNGKS